MNPIFVQVVGTGAATNVSPSLILHVEQHRFLFNCGEITRRFCVEHKIRVLKTVENILFTDITWSNVGGIADILIESTHSNINMIGPDTLYKFLLSTQTCLYRPELTLNITECRCGAEKTNLFPNTPVSIFPVVVSLKQNETKPALTQFPFNLKYSRWRKNPEFYSPIQYNDIVCYVVQTPDIPGKINVEKAVQLGVPKGPLFAQLKNGQPVTLPDGKMVHPNECVGDSTPGSILIIVTCPKAEYLPALLNHPGFSHLKVGQPTADNVVAMMHITPDSVLQSSEYQQFLSSFSSQAQHVVLNEKCPEHAWVIPTALRQRIKLNYLDSEVFPLYDRQKLLPLPSQKPPAEKTGDSSGKKSRSSVKAPEHAHQHQHASNSNQPTQSPKQSKIVYADNLMKVHVQPRGGAIDTLERIESSSIEETLQEITQDHVLMDLIHHAQKLVIKDKAKQPETAPASSVVNGDLETDEIIFLGTSGAAATKFRGETCILVRIKGFGNIVLDCGEGGFNQLTACFGLEKANQIVKDLKCVFISHKHADHMRGVVQLLTKRRDLFGLPSLHSISNNNHFKQIINPIAYCQHSCKQCLASFCAESSLARHVMIHDDQLMKDLYEQDVQNATEKVQTATFVPQETPSRDYGFFPENLVVIGSMWLETFLSEYNFVEPLFYTFVDCDELLYTRPTPNPTLFQYFARELGVTLQSVQVIHSFPTYGVVLEKIKKDAEEGWKVCFSGDTRPCEDLVRAGQNSTVLIHEANFEEDMASKAIKDRHSTTQEASLVGKRLAGTRIEARVPSLKNVELEPNKIAFAFDFMHVRLNRKLKELPFLVPPQQHMFQYDRL